MKKLSVICLFVAGIIFISGCIDEEKMKSKTSTSSQFEFNINSYYFVYMRDNVNYENNTIEIPTFDLVEKNYVIYHLAIKNNDINTFNFSINKLQLRSRYQVLTPAYPGIFNFTEPLGGCHYCMWVFSEITKENRLNDTLLHPDQTLEGVVIFQVDNYTTLFDRSFSLRYNTTPITSTSYEKSLEALNVAEQFDYSIAFDIPPYALHYLDYSYNPPEPEGDSEVWANWVNRTVFESYKKFDEMSLPKQKPESIPYVDIAYAVKVIPEQDLTVCQNTSGSYYRESGETYVRVQQMYVVDYTGKELLNKSIDYPHFDNIGLVILDNQTYRTFSENMTQMLIPHGTIVHFSFTSEYGWPAGMRSTFNNQDIILDEQHNITLARYDYTKYIS
jgi:hypothetical protein